MARTPRRNDRPVPAHPYRDTAVVYGFLAIVLVVAAWLTGGNPARAVLVAGAFFLLATAWSWWRFSLRIKERDAAATESATAEAAGRAVAVPGDDGGPSTNGRGLEP